MDKEFFSTQVDRLRSQWKQAYGEERQARLWFAFRNLSNQKFEEVVDRALDKMRAAPLVTDLLNLQDEIEREERSQRQYQGLGMIGFDLSRYAHLDKETDRELVKTCVGLVRKFCGEPRLITREVFYQGCDFIDEIIRVKHGNQV